MRDYIFRGFHPDENGSKIITLNGKKIRGEWIYWDCFGCSTKQFVRSVRQKNVSADYIFPTDIISETVGLLVTTDKNGKEVFEGDRVIIQTSNNGYHPIHREDVVSFDSEALEYLSWVCKGDMDFIEVVGNKWEVE